MRNLKAYQDSYGNLPFEERQVHYRRQKILEVLATYRPRHILEIGCGLDPIFNHYSDFDSFTVVEPAERFAEHAREQAKNLSQVNVVRGFLEDSNAILTGKSYDFILLSSLLHEGSDSKAMLDATARLCSIDTIVHVNVPNAYSFHRLLALEMGLIRTLHDRSETQQRMEISHTFDLQSLRFQVSQSKFEVVEQGSYFIKPFTHAQMASLQDSGLMSDLMLDGLYKLSKHFPENGSEIFMNLRLATVR